MPKTKFMVMVCACVSVCVDPSCQSFVIHLLPRVFWMVVRQTQIPGGRRILLQGWKLISNQTNQCQNVDRLMGAVMGLMSSWPFCHTIVIYLVRPFHLIAILHYYTLLGQFVRTGMLIYLAQPTSAGMAGRWVQSCFWIGLNVFQVGEGQGSGEPTGLWRESFSHYGPIPSGLVSGMWPCLSSRTRLTSAAGSRLGHSTCI